jgi:hypothetical protein
VKPKFALGAGEGHPGPPLWKCSSAAEVDQCFADDAEPGASKEVSPTGQDNHGNLPPF